MAEQSIQTTENAVQAIIKDAGLSIKFWVEAVKTDMYLQNQTVVRPDITQAIFSSKKAFTKTKLSINHL